MRKNKKIFDCIIVGAGPAGVAAAIYLKRAGFNILIVEKNEIGGTISNAFNIENYLSIKSISGLKFVELLKNQLKYNKISVLFDEILEVSYNDEFICKSKVNKYYSKSVLIATGSKPKKFDLFENNQKIVDRVFYNISDFRKLDKSSDILIIGGGDVAFDYALNLNKQSHKVKILARSSIKCIELLKEKVINNKINIIENCIFEKIDLKKDKLLLYTNNGSYRCDYIFIAIGREECVLKSSFTSNELCLKIGDVNNINYRQISIATGDALEKAMKIENILNNIQN